jgi:mannose-6-phosphate isomerase-like protein (cupin superfamily)
MAPSTIAPNAAVGRLTTAELAALVQQVAAEPAHWQAQLRFGAEERWWTRLHSDEAVDIWLLTWVRDTATDLHDHGDSAGAFIVVAGDLEEVRPVAATAELASTQVSAGDVREVPRGVVHDVRSPSLLPAISIHAYSPPLREMTFYEQGNGGTQPVRTVATAAEGALP